MDLDFVLRHVSRAQLLSIVDSVQKKIALWSGSISAGKTIASLIAFLLAIRLAPRTGLIVIVGNSLDTIYTNVFTNLQSPEIFGQRIVDQIHYTKGATSAVILGREVILVGSNNAASISRIQGKTIVLAYVDEATLLVEAFWNMLTTRLRVDGARLLATMNPASSNHWMRTEWILQAEKQNLIHFHFTMADNPALPEGYAEQMERSYSGVFYDRFIKGLWTNAAGAIYSQWDPTRHVIRFEDMPQISKIVSVGMDFGTSHPSAALMVGITHERDEITFLPRRRLILMDEWGYDEKKNNDRRATVGEQSQLYRAWLARAHQPVVSAMKPEFQILDSAAAEFREQLHRDGVTTWYADKAVTAGIGTVSTLIARDQLVVTDRCEGWMREVTDYRWDPKATARGEDAPIKEHDDFMDAGRYGIHTPRTIWQPIVSDLVAA
jgi:PBSX family phage terminase large subunit